jgi:hypothetical protein
MVVLISLLNLIIIIFTAISLGKVLTVSPVQRMIDDKEQMQWIKEYKEKRVQEKKK